MNVRVWRGATTEVCCAPSTQRPGPREVLRWETMQVAFHCGRRRASPRGCERVAQSVSTTWSTVAARCKVEAKGHRLFPVAARIVVCATRHKELVKQKKWKRAGKMLLTGETNERKVKLPHSEASTCPSVNSMRKQRRSFKQTSGPLLESGAVSCCPERCIVSLLV